MKLGEHITGRIESMAFGGEGILRHDGIVIFIPFAATDDEVIVEITKVQKSFARAKLLKILKPVNHRVNPRCPHFGICGGCQLQHLPYEEQLTLKHDFVVQSIKRIGKLGSVTVEPVIGATAQWNYRRVVKLRFQYTPTALKLGYVNADSNGVIDIGTCPIFSEDALLFKDLHVFLGRCFENSSISSGLLSLFRSGEDKFVAHLEIAGTLSKHALKRFEPLPAQLKGLLFSYGGRQHAFGDTSLQMLHAGQEFVYTPLSFVQNHAEQSAKINARIFDIVLASGAQRVFDLYCGFGVTAIGLAQLGIQVTAVETNAESIRLAQRNAQINGVTVNWLCADVSHFLSTSNQKHADLIIVNPPRTGLAPDVTQSLSSINSSDHIIYVSCMPQTLARDLALLAAFGFEVESCQPFDMFPQTKHVETLVSLRRLRGTDTRGNL